MISGQVVCIEYVMSGSKEEISAANGNRGFRASLWVQYGCWMEFD